MSVSSSAITADVHLHTTHSHGTASVAEMYASARSKGLSIIGFSEHSPRPLGYVYPEDYQEHLHKTFPAYIESVTALKKNSDQVTVLLGLELDYIPKEENYAKCLLQEYTYDYVIGGLHFLDRWGFDWSEEDWVGISEADRCDHYVSYYRGLISLAKSGLFNIAAHPDLIKIFSKACFNRWLDRPGAVTIISEALSAMATNGVAMEVSSAGLRKLCGEIYPGPVLMELAHKAGVSISFASDAHCVNTPAYAFDELARYAAHFGFISHVVFQAGKKRIIPFTAPSLL